LVKCRTFLALGCLASNLATCAEAPKPDQSLSQAKAQQTEALMQATQAINAEPKNPRGYMVRAQLYEETREPTKAVADCDEVLKLAPRLAQAWQYRGFAHFKLGHITEAISDFDRFIELEPPQAPYHWQRGIAYYYAGRFEEGRKQFESHQTVNPNDIENAVWHFLCVARTSGLEKARSSLIPIKGDARVPMKEVHALFAGTANPEEVMNAARAVSASAAQRNRALFYAHLYLGLFFEATNEPTKSREHIQKAADHYQTNDYMGDVARVHLLLRDSKPAPK
jgi:lipoprotein NlpI